jgi:TolB protein
VARHHHDTLPSLSSDGRRMAFIATSDGNPEIYLMNADGTGLFRVTHTKEEETAPQLSSDATHIIFSSNRAGRFAIYQIDAR